MSKTQKELEDALSLNLKLWYEIMQKFVNEGNILIDTAGEVATAQCVELIGCGEAGVIGMIFTTSKGSLVPT